MRSYIILLAALSTMIMGAPVTDSQSGTMARRDPQLSGLLALLPLPGIGGGGAPAQQPPPEDRRWLVDGDPNAGGATDPNANAGAGADADANANADADADIDAIDVDDDTDASVDLDLSADFKVLRQRQNAVVGILESLLGGGAPAQGGGASD